MLGVDYWNAPHKYNVDNIIVKGGDYKKEEIIGADICSNIVIFSFIDGYSTTQIIQNLSDR